MPEESVSCPNCNVGRRSGMVKNVLIAVSLSVSSCTACLPYGVPPCADGSSDCYDPCHPTSTSRTADGGLTRDDPTLCPTDGGQP